MTTTKDALRDDLAEARLRLSDLTRELNESPMVEKHDTLVLGELERVRERILDLERQLEALR